MEKPIMSIKSVHAALAFVAAVSLTLAACGKKEEPPQPQTTPPSVSMPTPPVAEPAAPVAVAPAEVAVAALTLGNAVGADAKVSAATETFAPADTIYVSVDTTGAGTAGLAVKWTHHKDGQVAVVKEELISISPSGPATTEFHVSKPDGWPAGDYEVEIVLNGKPAGSRKFVVR
jgi:predicted small lipoprotein YifL